MTTITTVSQTKVAPCLLNMRQEQLREAKTQKVIDWLQINGP